MATCAKNLMVLNIGEFAGLPSIIIPSLIGLSQHLNPGETLQVSAAETSWLRKDNYWNYFQFDFQFYQYFFILNEFQFNLN